MQIRQKMKKIWFLKILFKTTFPDVIFDVESESAIRFSKFFFVGEILAKNDLIMQIRQKIFWRLLSKPLL